MRRTVTAAILLAVVAASTTGCGFFHKSKLSDTLEYHFEVTGAGAQKISYAYTGLGEKDQEHPVAEDVATPHLPWTQAGIAMPGQIRLDVTPTDGPATCRIVVEKKELVKKEGPAGAPLSCVATAK